MNSSKDVVYAIAEEIGPDISYVRRKHAEQEAAYFTGVELGILFGGTVLANFLIGMLKGALEELSTAGGKRIGKSLAAKLIDKLTPIANQTHFKDVDTKQILAAAEQQEHEVDVVRETLIAEFTRVEFDRLVDAQVTQESDQISAHLSRNGFTQTKAATYSERLVQRIQRELKVHD